MDTYNKQLRVGGLARRQLTNARLYFIIIMQVKRMTEAVVIGDIKFIESYLYILRFT